ncbi:hypothetical protein [Nesterenkonia aurantiaca]|uniref:NIPSNAP protein n=1 Tax=Nesterenkonia aurantiaca TaxID=1436010 RepID=A0A4R7G4Y6_9MICC|nr:hypothetical protein [Nesterenkonia aurantiaca]TDS86411.1 hypothetical protein EV640_103100 [Nesterenkonia aurantiaca]
MAALPETPRPADAPERTTFMRRYTLDPALADEFVSFLTKRVIPAREERGFTVESIWLSDGKDELTWFVSRFGDREEFAEAERAWEDSPERAEIFTDAPAYVTGKDLRAVTRLS